jgi:hypothetical protein
MRRRVVSLIAAVAAALAITPVAGASESLQQCHRFGAEWKICYWLLEPNPSGGNVFEVMICEGATCIVI